MFDCIIGVSGGKYTRGKNKLKLKPLLVSKYPPQQITTRGTDNISNLIELALM